MTCTYFCAYNLVCAIMCNICVFVCIMCVYLCVYLCVCVRMCAWEHPTHTSAWQSWSRLARGQRLLPPRHFVPVPTAITVGGTVGSST